MTFKERLNREYTKEDDAANNNDPEIEGFDSEFFGIDNIKSYPPTIVLIFPDGRKKTVLYSRIEDFDFDPSEGIKIITLSKIVYITGRNLDKLFDYVTAFRVRYIRENAGTDTTESGLFVKGIHMEKL